RELIRLGVSYVPEDRLHVGLAASRSIEDNLVLKSYRRPPVSFGPFVKRKVVRENAEALIERFGVKAPGPGTSTRLLSGGNVQKVLLAREFTARPTVLIAASPTRGLDVGAIEIVRELLLEAARDGVGVLLMTEDLEEAIGMADRVLVMFEGRIIGEQRRGQTDVTTIGLMMGGKVETPAEEAES
ncbi:MAG: heme ABC transporter ATP-binding protein, partial [Actinobacteria bacterium]|nr:heme ABC transporter ATP-binding protein [Actinomycetota bacterium]